MNKIGYAIIKNAELLALIGEIDGIDLESEGYGVAVYLHIGNKKLKIIYDGGENISHHITRTGIACCIGMSNVKLTSGALDAPETE